MADFNNMRQEYEKYTENDHLVWQLLYDRQVDILPNRADEAFFDGMKKIGFVREAVPNFEEINKRLGAITGWKIVVVPGLIDNKPFFDFLENKCFPSSTWLRRLDQLDYLQEPDMFHDIFGHVPILTNHHFCNFLSALSTIALKHIDNEDAIEYVSRLYWYTVEFGLINTDKGLRIYGAGILSSPGESVYALEHDKPERVPFNVEEIMHTPYIKDRYQDKYFVIDSYKQLFESVKEVEETLEKMLALR